MLTAVVLKLKRLNAELSVTECVFVLQDAALVAMRSEVVAEVTQLRNQELDQAQQQLRQQLQQQVCILCKSCMPS